MREVNNTNITFGHLLLKITSKKFDEKEYQFDYFDGSGFKTLTILNIRVIVKLNDMIYQIESSKI